MTTFFATSIEHITTTKDGDKFIVSSSFAADGDTAKESEANAIASYEKAGHTADELVSITTVELDY